MNEKVLQAVIKLKDELSKPLKNVNNALKSTKKATESVTDSLEDNKKSMLTAKEARNPLLKESAFIHFSRDGIFYFSPGLIRAVHI